MFCAQAARPHHRNAAAPSAKIAPRYQVSNLGPALVNAAYAVIGILDLIEVSASMTAGVC